MKAVLTVTREWSETRLYGEKLPAALMPFIDRPFIQHVLEYLIGQGVTDFDVAICQFPEKIEYLLGSGIRWGVNIRYHLVKDPHFPFRLLKPIHSGTDDDPLLLVDPICLCLIDFDLRDLTAQISNNKAFTRYDFTGPLPDGRPNWTGWAWLSRRFRDDLPDHLDRNSFLEYFQSFPREEGQIITVADPIHVHTPADLLAFNKAVLDKKVTQLILTGKEVENSIWISRNVNLHPTASIAEPVYIGQNCRIGKGVKLGPHVVVGDNCIIDANTHLSDSVIFPGSYVGEALELCDVIVDRNTLINTRIGTAVTITENFILDSMAQKHKKRWVDRFLSQFFAIFILGLSFPLILILAAAIKLFRNGPLLYRKEAICLPTRSDHVFWRSFCLLSFCPDMLLTENRYPEDRAIQQPSQMEGRFSKTLCSWHGLIFRFLPALFNVARGQMRFVGVPPRSKEEIKALPQSWRSLYLRSKPGIITEALVTFGPRPTEDEQYSAETFYSVLSGIRYDLKLLGKFFAQLLGLRPKPNH
jgi:NDP-sugar pyrophosphorylase family protein